MSDKENIISELEEDLSWRSQELKFLKNQMSQMTEDDKLRYRKMLVVMLYSHYEGFCKRAFEIYIDNINNLKVKRKEVIPSIRAASMYEVFFDYENPNKKDNYFKKDFPDDKKLHRYSSQISFVKDFENFLEEAVFLPEKLVDTESNLKPIVLKKLLFRLGFLVDEIDIAEGTINLLLNLRNNIAHGTKLKGIENKEFTDLEEKVYELLNQIREIILQAILSNYHLISN